MKLLFSFLITAVLAGSVLAADIGQILVFSAPWCPSCKTEIPRVKRVLKSHESAASKAVLMVITGNSQGSKPSDSVSKAYVEKLDWQMGWANDPWKTQIASKYYSKVYIPALVVLDTEGNPIKVFEPGDLADPLEEFLNAAGEK